MRQRDCDGQAAAPCRRCTQHSAGRSAQPCPCAMTAHRLRTHLAVQGGQFLQLSALQTVHGMPATLCCKLTSASMPFLTSAARNEATSSDSGAGNAHPSKRMSSMSTVHGPAHLRQGACLESRGSILAPMPRGCHHDGPHRRAGCLVCSTWCIEAVLCHFSSGQQPVLRTDIIGNIARCHPRHPHRAPQHASSPQTWH